MRVINWDTNQPTAILSPLTTSLTVFQAANGSDANTGGSAANPFLTLQGAFAYLASNNIFNGNNVLIQCASGQTLTSGIFISGGWTGAGSLTIDLGTSTLAPTSGNAVTVSLPLTGGFIIQNGTIEATGTSASCIVAENTGSIIQVGAGITFGTANLAHMIAQNSGEIIVEASYTVNGNATYHIVAQDLGLISFFNSVAVTVSGTPTFSIFALSQFNGVIQQGASNSFTGSANGPKYYCQFGGGIDTQSTGNVNFYSGSSAGSPLPVFNSLNAQQLQYSVTNGGGWYF